MTVGSPAAYNQGVPSIPLLFLLLLRLSLSPHVINLTAASDDRFLLEGRFGQVLHVKAGEALVFRVTAHHGSPPVRDGAVHSMVVRSLRDQGWDIRLKEGLQEVSLQAPAQPGTYLIECTVPCGPGHLAMNLQMVVDR